MKEPVVQLDSLGCGVACAAFVLGKSYNEVRPLFNSNRNFQGVYTPTLVKVLNTNGLNYTRRKVNYKNRHLSEIDNAIIFIDSSCGYDEGHYLARYNGKFMNPWVNFPENHDLSQASAAFVNELPGEPLWVVYPV